MQTYFYDSHNADSQLNSRSGQVVELLRPLSAEEADLEETGPMFQARFPDGFETAVFADEVEIPCCDYCKGRIEVTQSSVCVRDKWAHYHCFGAPSKHLDKPYSSIPVQSCN